MIADQTVYDACYSSRPLSGIAMARHEYLLVSSFKLKSVFDAWQPFIQLLCFVAKQ